jgi:hypothetical protein
MEEGIVVAQNLEQQQFSNVDLSPLEESTASTTTTPPSNTATTLESSVVGDDATTAKPPRPLTVSQLEELGRVEQSAIECARNFTEISARLRANLKDVTANSEKYMDAYKLATENLQEQVNESLVAMHTLITKCQELNVDFKRIHEMAAEIKAIRRDVDTLYALINVT